MIDSTILILEGLSGHVFYYFSALMAPKLSEMDDVLKMIRMSSILNQKNDQGQTLLVRHFSFLVFPIDRRFLLMAHEFTAVDHGISSEEQ